jgi:flagellar hook-associated protein 1 FlgK
MQSLNTALSGLISSQYAIDQTANNISNANTPGFHRREVQMVSRRETSVNGLLRVGGSTVDIITRARNLAVESSLTSATGDLASIENRLVYENRLEFFFSNRPGSLYERFNSLFGELGKLSTDPQQSAQRNVVLQTGEQLAGQFKQLGDQLLDLKQQAQNELKQQVGDLNTMLNDLANLQLEIKDRVSKQPPNDLLEQRDQMINRIAEIIDVSRNEFVQDGLGLSLAGGSLSLGAVAPKIEIQYNQDGSVQLQIGSQGRPLTPRGGRLAALLETHNTFIPEYENRMRALAGDVIRNFNQTHAQGIGAAGPFSLLNGSNFVKDVSVPLAQAGLPFDFSAGDLYVTVTGPGGERRVSKLSLDPATQSLNDVGAAFSGIPNLQGVVDSQTGQLRILADPGYRFDFTGRLETVPDLTGFTGTATPRISGDYTGKNNDQLRVVVNGSGTVGLTAGLTADVFDGGGNLLKTVSIGSGYEAGKAIEVYQGVKVSFAAGAVANGDEFNTFLVANSDQGKFLSALGLNGFFQGSDPLSIAVDPELKSNPSRISLGKTGEFGDTSVIKKMLALREQPLADGGLTFEGYHAETTALSGSRVRTSGFLQSQLKDLKTDYEQQREGFSGIDINEEMVKLSKFQRAYEATVRVLTAMDQMMQELMSSLR